MDHVTHGDIHVVGTQELEVVQGLVPCGLHTHIDTNSSLSLSLRGGERRRYRLEEKEEGRGEGGKGGGLNQRAGGC